MAETSNIGEIAAKISKDIFKHFLWETHPKRDDNFQCANESHVGEGGKPKGTHPGDIVFHYDDPYLGKRIYLHTDLKSYASDSITATRLRGAFKSLCMTIECAKESAEWREKYSVDASEPHDVRGMLFIHNHDNGYEKSFYDAIDRIDLQKLPVAPGSILHFLGPHDIQRLYSIGNDIIRLKVEDDLPKEYTFFYPDLVMKRRQGDVWWQAATIETLTGPYIIIKHGAINGHGSGYVIYYNRSGDSPEEFEYFLDSLSRYQMLESSEKIRIRVTGEKAISDLKSIFHTAKKKYAKAWGFDPAREAILDKIEIDRVTSVASTYNPGDMGWKE
ncbi:hypothetical protein [Burkholderia cepacia]|uniref:hypothetical protein n=1 Tax=Burkholderia cepacia TaxID=292 RepID=UPI00264E28D5|nr:hypothetical protein [Burkholderia cepacia]MDN7909080.1 hypothetical protein [Burkholderia cepacia]